MTPRKGRTHDFLVGHNIIVISVIIIISIYQPVCSIIPASKRQLLNFRIQFDTLSGVNGTDTLRTILIIPHRAQYEWMKLSKNIQCIQYVAGVALYITEGLL